MTNVIQIEDMRLTKAKYSFFSKECKHLNLTMHSEGDIVTCDDCNKQVSAFWALQMLSDHYQRASEKLKNRCKVQEAVEQKTVHLKAAQNVEAAWRSRTMVPVCPHCSEPIFANDGFGGAQINKEMAQRRRTARTEQKQQAEHKEASQELQQF